MEIISKYLEDKRFITWVFYPNDELEKWWAVFETDHPKEKQNIQLARNVLLKLKTSHKNLSEEEKILLFSKILKQIEEKQKAGKAVRVFTGMLKYAAIAILFFSLGAILFYKKDNHNPNYAAFNFTEPISQTEAQLIRPGGESIHLENKKSVIEYVENGGVKVNNTIIDSISSPGSKSKVPELHQLIIPYGNTSEIRLPDGTKVFLNAGSRLVYPEFFKDKNREVLLVGEAYFEVWENSKQPFIVQTTDLRVKVLGTKFNISAYPSDNVVETVLTEGSVSIEQNNSALFEEDVVLVPGQLAAFNKSSKKSALKTVNTEVYTLWKDGLCRFEGTDLNRVTKKLERFYNVRFNYTDPLLGTIKITGKLELDENKEEIINRIAVTASVQIQKVGEYIYEIKK